MKKIFHIFLIALLVVPFTIGLSACDFTTPQNRIDVIGVYNTNPANTIHIDTIYEPFDDNELYGLKWEEIGNYGHSHYRWNSLSTPVPTHTGNHSMFLGLECGIVTKNLIQAKAGDTIDLSFWRYTGGNNFVWQVSYDGNGLSGWIDLGEPITSNDSGWVKIERTINITNAGKVKLQIFSTSTGKTDDDKESAFIDDVTYTHTTMLASFKAGESITLTSAVFPVNATHSGVYYEIIEGGSGTGATLLSSNVLTATGPGVIKLRPKAISNNHGGGVTHVPGDPFFVKVTE